MKDIMHIITKFETALTELKSYVQYIQSQAQPKQKESAKDKDSLQEFIVLTDGSCSGNPGPGGYAFLVLDRKLNELYEESGFLAEETTNNKAEIGAILKAVEWLPKNAHAVIITDSLTAVRWMTSYCANSHDAQKCLDSIRELMKQKNLRLTVKHLTRDLAMQLQPFHHRIDKLAKRAAGASGSLDVL